jgi:transglutaminase-like putative cysteine protease
VRIRVQHETVYEYAEPAFDSHNEVRLQPIDDELQRCLGFSLTTDPPANTRTRRDYFGNVVHYFSIPGYHRRLSIRAEALVVTFESMAAIFPPPGPVGLPSEAECEADDRLMELREASTYVPLADEVVEVAGDLKAAAHGDGLRFWEALLAFFKGSLTYEKGATTVEDDALDVLRRRRGVCQDFAHLTIALARAAGVPARYVSGYVRPSEGESQASHAWAELYLPGPGWLGIDPSGPGMVDHRYVRVAYGRDYADANPVRGAYRGGGSSNLSVDVSVQQVQQQ